MVYGDGHVFARDIKVTLGTIVHSDFVFEKNYKLTPLEDVEIFNEKYKHLRDVPSKEDVKKNNGINLGEMIEIGLQKTEELFLYVIELNKKFIKLNATILLQQKEIELLQQK